MHWHSAQPLAAACFASTLVATAPAAADDRAEVLFNRGVEDMEARRFDLACPAIEESYNLDPRLGVLFALAECEAQRGRIATAVARYDEYLALVAKLPPDKQRKQRDREKTSRAQKAALTPQIPELALTLPAGAPAGTIVKRDGVELDEAALGVSVAVDPGAHVVTTQAPGGPETEVRVTIARGDKKQLTLKVRPPRVDAPPVSSPGDGSPPPPPSAAGGMSGQRMAAYVVGGVAVTGIVLGGVMGGLALSKKSTVDANCKEESCTLEGKAAADSLQSFGLVSTIGFATGAASLVTAVVLFLTEPAPPKGSGAMRPPPRAGAARWVSAGVLSAGPAGATFGLYGGW